MAVQLILGKTSVDLASASLLPSLLAVAGADGRGSFQLFFSFMLKTRMAVWHESVSLLASFFAIVLLKNVH